MERHGFVHDMLDVKVLILYIMARVSYPVDLQKIYELSYQDDGLSYFDVAEAVPQMIESGHLERVDGERYVITEKGREAAKTHRQGVTWAHKHGVKICVGTDLLPSDPVDGTNATVREIELLVQCGLSPMEAIKAATSTGAELCGLQDVTGTLKPGLMGDFIVVEGKPDENISDLRKLRLVAKHCRLIWSTLPNLNVRRFSVLAPGYEMKGGTFCDWRLI